MSRILSFCVNVGHSDRTHRSDFRVPTISNIIGALVVQPQAADVLLRFKPLVCYSEAAARDCSHCVTEAFVYAQPQHFAANVCTWELS